MTHKAAALKEKIEARDTMTLRKIVRFSHNIAARHWAAMELARRERED